MKLTIPVFLATVFMLGCQTKMAKKDITVPELKKTPASAEISKAVENVRRSPNGIIIGKIRKGQKIIIDRRFANWLLFHNDRYDSAFVWAPSAGFKYINLYNPFTYFDSTANRFYPLDYFKDLFGSEGKKRSIISTRTEVFFSRLGLGSHEDVVMEVVDREVQEVQHGITLHLTEPAKDVYQVEVDFFRPVKGIESALQKCEISVAPPDSQNHAALFWNTGTLISNLTIELERREWKSDWFSAIWFKEGKFDSE